MKVKGGQNLPYIIQIDILDQFKERMITVSDEEIEFKLISSNQSDTFNARFISKKVNFTKGRVYLYD